MATLDIRGEVEEAITEIKFADEEAMFIRPVSNYVTIRDDLDCIIIDNKEHAENLIKALKKAIELGWLI